MIAIIDSGGANISSILFALQRLGKQAQLTKQAKIIQQSSHVILPGVGAAAAAMKRIRELNLQDVIPKLTQPVLGFCLGMQLLYEYSTENVTTSCLGIIPGTVKKIAAENLPIPHMGWNQIKISNRQTILKDIADQQYFYFIHSFCAPINKATIATACYGEEFSAACQWNNFYATQFHPERSGQVGAQILKNFLELR